MLILIENGEIYSPEPQGKASVLLADSKILKIGKVERASLDKLGVEYEVVDANGCCVTPGMIDAHQHLLGGSGENGFSTQTPELSATEIIQGAVTTVVGCLGVDTTMKTMPGLLGKVKALKEEGLSAYMWTGGYNVPPTTITGTVRSDIMFIEEIIGIGEIAIADERSTDPTIHELARLTNDAYVAGMMSKKCGVSHFHVGDRDERMKLLFELLDCYKTPPQTIYATHIERSEELMAEAAKLSKRGCFVDIDTVDEDLAKQLEIFANNRGDMAKLTVSSDSSTTPPATVFEQLRDCVINNDFTLERVLPLVTSNVAEVLKLERKGKLEEGCDADILVLEKESLELLEVISGGDRLFRDGSLAFKEAFLADSKRKIELEGEKPLKSVAA
jgi:beta-aspartyl-dipeptidase (metallo-type)